MLGSCISKCFALQAEFRVNWCEFYYMEYLLRGKMKPMGWELQKNAYGDMTMDFEFIWCINLFRIINSLLLVREKCQAELDGGWHVIRSLHSTPIISFTWYILLVCRRRWVAVTNASNIFKRRLLTNEKGGCVDVFCQRTVDQKTTTAIDKVQRFSIGHLARSVTAKDRRDSSCLMDVRTESSWLRENLRYQEGARVLIVLDALNNIEDQLEWKFGSTDIYIFWKWCYTKMTTMDNFLLTVRSIINTSHAEKYPKQVIDRVFGRMEAHV